MELPESLRGGWRKGEEMLLYCSAVAMTLQPFKAGTDGL